MTATYADKPLVGSVDANGEPMVFTYRPEIITSGGGKQVTTLKAEWNSNEVYCGTCRCRASRDPKADTCDCRCHETWQQWHEKFVEASR